MPQIGETGLERSCGIQPTDWMHTIPEQRGLERVEASFRRGGFAPHRHDRYAIGITLQGVQAFSYRGTATVSLPGQVFVLHPDERHDGRAGTETGFRYRTLYVDPDTLRDAMDDQTDPLPFVPNAVSHDRRLAAAIRPALLPVDEPLDDLFCDQFLAGLAEVLLAADPTRTVRRSLQVADWRAVGRARDFLRAHVTERITSTDLEAVTGLSRYAIARHFRAWLGTSPHRYLIQRRLDMARNLILTGMPLAAVAAASGFADQSHMTRHFIRTFGLTPGRLAAMTGSGPASTTFWTG